MVILVSSSSQIINYKKLRSEKKSLNKNKIKCKMYLLQMDELVKSEKRGYMNWAGWRSHKKIDIK